MSDDILYERVWRAATCEIGNYYQSTGRQNLSINDSYQEDTAGVSLELLKYFWSNFIRAAIILRIKMAIKVKEGAQILCHGRSNLQLTAHD